MTIDLMQQFAAELGAVRVPSEKILRAWKKATEGSVGCLNNNDGMRMFTHNRLVEYGCFDVGCRIDEIRLTCELHIMDPSHWDCEPNLVRDFCRAFFSGDSIAATQIRKLIDAKPINELAKRAHQFPSGSANA